MEQVFVAEHRIKRANEVKYFQMTLPEDALAIIGIECSVRLKENFNLAHPASNGAFEFARNQKVGELKLQSCNDSNIFYSTDVNLDTNGFAMADFNADFAPNCYTHQSKKTEDVINVPVNAAVIYGLFKDHLIADVAEPWEYTIKLYVWYDISDFHIHSKHQV